MVARSASTWAWDFSARNSAMRSLSDSSSGLGLGGFLTEFGGVLGPPFGTLLAAIEDDAQHLFQPGRIEQALLQMLGHQIIQALHGDRSAFAAAGALPGGDGTSVVAIAT
jgi:hypothetical protein